MTMRADFESLAMRCGYKVRRVLEVLSTRHVSLTFGTHAKHYDAVGAHLLSDKGCELLDQSHDL